MKTVKVTVMSFLVVAVGIMAGMATEPQDYTAFGDSDDAVLGSTMEATTIALDLAKESLTPGGTGNSDVYLFFAAEHFGKQVQELRTIYDSTDADVDVDEIHITLLDLLTISDSDILPEIDKARMMLSQITYDESTAAEQVIVNLLTLSDEQYQTGILQDSDESIQIAKRLIQRSEVLFELTNFDERLTLEIQSFFNDLNEHVENRSEFLKVGGLIIAIQKDILGTESVSFDYQTLYQTIRELYDEMLVQVDSGDYTSAEENAIIAYLDNFEYLEADIERIDKDLLYVLEINMREELRDMIADNAPPDEIREFVNNVILPDLNLAESLVAEQYEANPDILNTSRTPDVLRQAGDSTEEEKTGVRAEVDYIRNALLDVVVLYENEEYESAYTTARSAYLDSYEFVEIPLREIAPDFTLEVEYQFAELRNMIKSRDSLDKIRDVVIAINRNLDESERLVSGTGVLAPSIAFMSSFAIIFREGLESVLILGAILTYLESSRNNRLKKYVHYGVIAAVGATAATWVVASYIIDISGANRELIEAIAALSATAMLFYVSFWVLNKIEHKKWMEFVKAKVWQATTTGSVMVFVMLAFFTVYREGFETVLFYQAMAGFARHMEAYVGLGFVVGMATLFVIYFVMRKLGKRLPLRALFGLTMGVGAYLSIAFLGNAIRELQIIDVLPYTGMIGTIPRLDINIASMTGIYPTLETVVGQVILLGVYLVAVSYVLILRPRKERQLAQMRKSRRHDDAAK
ncbi:MAG: FTR1 family iron permease [Thaumarchaeota archaeon]|nr:FTR1 family iron permease [Nitrososphaerota archaeon]